MIIPVYNVEEYLDKCLESLLNQHYSDMEILVVDDKSTDGSLNIAKKYEKYTNVKVIAKERNSGLSDTRNVGIKESCGQYIMFLDSDDYVENGCIAKIQGIIEKKKLNVLLHTITVHLLNIIQIQRENEYNLQLIIIPRLLEQQLYVEMEHIVLAKAVEEHAHIMVELQNG